MNDITNTTTVKDSSPTKPAAKKRKVGIEVLYLRAGPDLQAKIDSIPSTMPNVQELTIYASDESYDKRPKLAVSMPKLKKLKLENVDFQKITLTPGLTPNLKELMMDGIPDDCDLTVKLPNLLRVYIAHYGPSEKDEWIDEMLTTATKLNIFHSHQLQVEGLLMTSNNLQAITIYSSYLLSDLVVYAPRLLFMNLWGCDILRGRIVVLDSYPGLKAPLKTTRFLLQAFNTSLSTAIRGYLSFNPRVTMEDLESDDESDDDEA
jgi:hypothetical protein